MTRSHPQTHTQNYQSTPLVPITIANQLQRLLQGQYFVIKYILVAGVHFHTLGIATNNIWTIIQNLSILIKIIHFQYWWASLLNPASQVSWLIYLHFIMYINTNNNRRQKWKNLIHENVLMRLQPVSNSYIQLGKFDVVLMLH